MKNVSPPVRRVLGIALALVAGTLATLAVATPASAHYSTVSGKATCDSATGTFQVTWTIAGNSTDKEGTINSLSLTPSGTNAGDIFVGATVPKPDGTLVGVQVVPGTASKATLTERTKWTDDYVDSSDKVGEVDFTTACLPDQPKPNVTFKSLCDGSVTGTLTDDQDATKAATFSVLANGATTQYQVAIGGSKDFTLTPKNGTKITVKVGDKVIGEYTWKAPADCAPVKVSSKSDCTSLTVTLENPAGNAPVDATVSSGDKSEGLTVGGGESKSVTFPASTGTTASVTFGAGAAAAAKVAIAAADTATRPITIDWAPPGAVCTPTSPPSLPQTGAKVGGVIAAGFALVVVGGGLLLMLRRRRTATAAR